MTSGVSSDALQRALEILVSELDACAGDYGVERLELTGHVQELGAILSGSGDIPNPASLTASQAAILTQLLDQLQAIVHRIWSEERDAGAAPELLDLLAGIERARAGLRTEETRDAFAGLISSIHGPELLVGLAHDLRSPLTSVLFLAETLWRGQSGDLNETQVRQLGIIYSAALSLVSLAGDVIELARGGDRLMEKETSAFSVSHLFESVQDLVRPMVEERGLVLRVMPPRIDRRLGFPVALSRVLLNLTTNAIKFTERGHVDLVARDLGDSRIEFSVRDEGAGIPPEALPDLYKPFRANPSGERHGFSGTGLGLSICRKLVTAMGGTLEVESVRGVGTRFYFVLELEGSDRL